MTAGLLTALLGGLAIVGHLLAGWWRRRKDARTIATLQVEKAVAVGKAEVAEATVIVTAQVDDRQAEAREVARAAENAPAVLAATTPAERVDAATDLLRHDHGHPMDAATASRRAADRVRAKIAGRKP